MWVVHLLAFLHPSLFVSSLMVLSTVLLLDFYVTLSLPAKFQKERTSQYSSELRTCEGPQLSDFHKETSIFKKGKRVDERLPTLPPW
jgi:hypothetical protein